MEDLDWQGNYGKAGLRRDGDSGLLTFFAEWPAGTRAPSLELKLRLGTRQRLFDITRRGATPETEEVLNQNLQSLGPWPQDVLAELAERITGRIREPMPCGPGHLRLGGGSRHQLQRRPRAIQAALCARNDGGAGLAGIFVALCRACGYPPPAGSAASVSALPASPPAWAPAATFPTAQHWRAEFHAPFYCCVWWTRPMCSWPSARTGTAAPCASVSSASGK